MNFDHSDNNYLDHENLTIDEGNDKYNFTAFNRSEIVCLAKHFLHSKKFEQLRIFLESIPNTNHIPPCFGDEEENELDENILMARACLANHDFDYDYFKEIINVRNYKKKNHPYLQGLWNEIHYSISARNKERESLIAVERYRVRRKHEFPLTIWDGEPTSYKFPQKARKLLVKSFLKEPKPSSDEKTRLAQETGLTSIQISNWFKNRRQRDPKKKTSNMNKMKQITNKRSSSSCSKSTVSPQQSTAPHYQANTFACNVKKETSTIVSPQSIFKTYSTDNRTWQPPPVNYAPSLLYT